MHIWKKLKTDIIDNPDENLRRPLIVLAPMADVTDIAFRTLIAECGKPDMMWTEFVSADGIVRATPEGKIKLMADLMFGPTEHPIVAQLFGSNPEHMEEASYLAASLGFDGIDINMGCPDKSIEKQGAGAGMIKNPKRAQEIIFAAKRGAERAFADKVGLASAEIVALHGLSAPIEEPIPVSVKTRIGYTKNELSTWLPALLETHPAAITIHARTRKEMSLVPARWEHVTEAVAIRDQVQADMAPIDRTLILGNGDVLSVQDGMEKCAGAGADGAMLGRALFGNPWLFSYLKKPKTKNTKNEHTEDAARSGEITDYNPTIEEKLQMAIRHTELFEQHLGTIKNFAIMKKHFKAYINGFDGAKELRMELMEKGENAADVRRIIGGFLKK
jgi:tRNA-dihydrouridine synthase B